MCERQTTVLLSISWGQRTELEEVEGTLMDDAPGLAVTPEVHEQICGTRTGRSRVTHLETGMSIPAWFRSSEDAMRFARIVAKKLDWTEKNINLDAARVASQYAMSFMPRDVCGWVR